MDEHLIETFYITRPHPQPEYLDNADTLTPPIPSESSTQHSIGQVQPLPPPKPTRDVYFQRSYRMISKQLNCSAAVSVWRGKGASTKKSPQQQGSPRFMQQFEDYFRSFIPPECNLPQPLRKRRSSRNSQRQSRERSQRQSQQSAGSSSDREEVQERREVGFYGKMKGRIGERVEPLIDKSNRSKLRRVETRPKSKKTVAEVLKEKRNLKECQPHLRLSRTGLVIRLDSMETKANESNLRKIEALKPKKDMIFQRCLIKNCEIVLENLQSYQQQQESAKDFGDSHKNSSHKGGKEKQKEHRRHNSSILHKTTVKPKPTHASSHTQDLSLLKLREKCLDIELTCKRSYKNNGGIKQGLKVFGKYCRRMQRKMEAGEERICALMAEEEREEDAGRLYDCMANIQPLQAYLSSVQ